MIEKPSVFLAAMLLAASLPLAAAPGEKTKPAPANADPVTIKRLVQEAAKARAEGDIQAAMVKLDEAKEKAPHDPDVISGLVLLYEEMAKADKGQKARPEITDPKLKQLVEEARKARAATDPAAALVKLNEAREKAPKDPNVLYERALLFEEMAKSDPRLKGAAAGSYQEVLKLGEEKAGPLWMLAAQKLTDGI